MCTEKVQGSNFFETSFEDSARFTMSASGVAADHNNIAVICNLQIYSDRPELRSLRYTFFEWYDLPFLCRFKPLHFTKGSHEPPKILNASQLNGYYALFWNGKWISE